jgi:hypothetical protein
MRPPVRNFLPIRNPRDTAACQVSTDHVANDTDTVQLNPTWEEIGPAHLRPHDDGVARFRVPGQAVGVAASECAARARYGDFKGDEGFDMEVEGYCM